MQSLLVLMLSVSIFASAHAAQIANPEDSADLSWSMAQERSRRIEKISYAVDVSVGLETERFDGIARIGFTLKSEDKKPLRLDFFEGEINEILLNDQVLPASIKKKYWIDLPFENLKLGENKLQIKYRQAYSTQGQGLHRFVDPESKEIFLYSQFEAYDANRFMPCFDQPDLRATFQLQVEAPAHWSIISTTRETAKKNVGIKRQQWMFPASLPIATYLFSLHAGPFKVWESRYQNIPLRIFARPSMAKFVPTEEWFRVTQQGFKFFSDYFKAGYPYKKYDQVFVPEFNAGAMENVAAVTFSENYLGRGEMTREEKKDGIDTLLHEMAHMWFGNMVTMRWWNDLWLNESFATYMSALAMSEATEYKEAWLDFQFGSKQWAYWEDQLPTTHPIEAAVPTVKVAFANFDGITYGKGASVLKQLSHYMGAENFRDGLRKYIRRHSGGNAELKDFIASLQTQTQKKLSSWSKVWLRQTGFDRLVANWQCKGDRLNQIEIQTRADKGVEHRPQALEILLTSSSATAPATMVSIVTEAPSVTINGNWPCPDFVYPNAGDFAYAGVQLDAISLHTLQQSLARTPDHLLRAQLWHNLWEMVRQNEMSLSQYTTIVEQNFSGEKTQSILAKVSRNLTGGFNEDGSVLQYWPVGAPAKIQGRKDFAKKMETLYLEKLTQAKSGSDLEKFWLDKFVVAARSSDALDRIAEWMRKSSVSPAFKLDPDRAWAMAKQLARFDHPKAKELAAKLALQDKSERAKNYQLAIEAVRPDLEVKKKWVAEIRKAKSELSFSELSAVAENLFPSEQDNLAKNFETDFYEYVKANAKSEDEVIVEAMAPRLAPLFCDSATTKRVKDFVKANDKNLSPLIRKSLLVSIDEDERCQRVRAKNEL